MKSMLLLCLCLLLAPYLLGAEETRTRVGQQMPSFTVSDIAGQPFDIRALAGKVIVVNFWATWCPPCRAELPRLENEIWRKFKSDGLVMIGIAREETQDVVAKFAAKQPLSYRLAADPDRAIYKLFAASGIPRTYVVDRDGKIVFQSVGYDPAEFDRLKQVLASELSGAPAR